MTRPEARPELGEQLIETAVTHYIDCLTLPPTSQVLIVTDLLPQGANVVIDPDTAIRTRMSGMIANRLAVGGYRTRTVTFDHSMSREDIYQEASQALVDLDQTISDQPADRTTTVVYLGDVWANRHSLYNAASDFGKDRKVRVALSLGFSTGDCRVMSQLTPERRAAIDQANNYFEAFFRNHPRGRFRITTADSENNTYSLQVDYDTAQVPFATDLGWFNDRYITHIGNFEDLNIPGGEKFGSPFPFQHSQGKFIAEGICFHITEGMIDGVTAPEEVLEGVTEPSQLQLINIIRNGGKIPLSELGLGFYGVAGIETYSDSSTLSREKGGPHAGMGTDPSGNSPEAETMELLSGDFHHTDFVMDNPVIKFIEPDTQQTIPFYPPQK